jgi:hypothetical protein
MHRHSAPLFCRLPQKPQTQRIGLHYACFFPPATYHLLSLLARHTAGFNFFQVLSEPFANLIILAFGQLLLEFV